LTLEEDKIRLKPQVRPDWAKMKNVVIGYLLLLFMIQTYADTSVIKNVKVMKGKLKFNCMFKLTHTDTTVNTKKSLAVCTPSSPKNKGPFNINVVSGKFQFTITLKINPEKIILASVTTDEGHGSGSEPNLGHESLFTHGPWGEWSKCFGCTNLTERSRIQNEMKTCNGNLSPLGWSEWSHWSYCAQDNVCRGYHGTSGNQGISLRRRVCKDPKNSKCEGEAVEFKRCTNICCIEDTSKPRPGYDDGPDNYKVVECPPIRHTFNAMIVNFPSHPVKLIPGKNLDINLDQSTDMSIKKLTENYGCSQSRLTKDQSWSSGLLNPSLSYFDSRVYICSGFYYSPFDGSHEIDGRDTCMILDPLTEEWTQLPAKLNFPRSSHVSVALGDTLYILGGYSQETYSWILLDNGEYQDPRTFIKEVEKYKLGSSSFVVESWTLDDLGFPAENLLIKSCSLAFQDKLVLSHERESGFGSGFQIVLVGADGEVTKVPSIEYYGDAGYNNDDGTFNDAGYTGSGQMACTLLDSKLMVVLEARNRTMNITEYWRTELHTHFLNLNTMSWEESILAPWTFLYSYQYGSIIDLEVLDGVPNLITADNYENYYISQWNDDRWTKNLQMQHRLPYSHAISDGYWWIPIPPNKLNQKC